MFGPSPSGQRRVWSIAHQNSSSVSPFQANVGIPASAIAAAAWSCVEKMLQLAQRTCAPSATSVSISTAVCTVMWSEPVMRAPASGCEAANSSRIAISPGISCSARAMSRRPYSASERSATLKSSVLVAVAVLGGVMFWASPVELASRRVPGLPRCTFGPYRASSAPKMLSASVMEAARFERACSVTNDRRLQV